jgi:hypothetical protein
VNMRMKSRNTARRLSVSVRRRLRATAGVTRLTVVSRSPSSVLPVLAPPVLCREGREELVWGWMPLWAPAGGASRRRQRRRRTKSCVRWLALPPSLGKSRCLDHDNSATSGGKSAALASNTGATSARVGPSGPTVPANKIVPCCSSCQKNFYSYGWSKVWEPCAVVAAFAGSRGES